VNHFGAEFVEARMERDHLAARGVVVESSPFPYWLDYEFETGEQFVTKRLLVTIRGDDFSRKLELRRSAAGLWSETVEEEGASTMRLPRPPTNVDTLAGALDVDMELSPFFNSMPVLRHDLLRRKGTVDFVMAWVSIPSLAVHGSPQRYSHIRPLTDGAATVRFDSLAGDGFVADVSFDGDGLVIDYPGIAARIP